MSGFSFVTCVDYCGQIILNFTIACGAHAYGVNILCRYYKRINTMAP
jgi:hypothetical protein